MQRHGGPAQMPQHDRQLLRVEAGVDKDHDGVMLEVSDQGRKVRLLELVRYEHVVLHQGLHCVMLGANLYLHRSPQGSPLQLRDLGSHRRGEEEGVPVARHHLQDLVQGLVEVHGEKPVGLVHDYILDRPQVEALGVLQVIHEPTGRGHNHVRALGQRHCLGHHVQSAHDDRCGQLDAGAYGLELLPDLHAELARGGQHHRKEALRVVQKPLHDRQGEGTRLTAPRLGQADDVAAL
mmetsp:Transcript_109614/g.320821  ORF Transcript_109614/g.320821 Transcript_109614/m.320821 type:complete len:236 (+) Transcript_109614:541-1248(+)